MVVRRVNPELVALVILVRFVVCCVGLYFCVYVCVCVLVSVCYLSHAQIEKNDSRFKSVHRSFSWFYRKWQRVCLLIIKYESYESGLSSHIHIVPMFVHHDGPDS